MTIIPVWPFAPEWTNPISETLEWLTAIQASVIGAEQRQALRPFPRRTFDMPFQLHELERSYFEVLINKYGGGQWQVPMPHEGVRISSPVPAGTFSFTFDATYREFRATSNAILIGDDAFSTELVEVTSISDTGITTMPTVRNYDNGCTIYPAMLAQITDKITASRKAGRVYTGTIRFQSAEPVIWPTATRDLATTVFSYDGGSHTYPVLTEEPNAIEDLDYIFERLNKVVDNSTSIPKYTDKGVQAFTSQKYSWFLVGRKAQQDFRDLLFTLKGRQGAIWVPTFNDDLGPTGKYPDPNGLVATTFINRSIALQFLRGGTFNVITMGPYTTGDRVPPAIFDSSTVYRTSYMSLKRLDVDSIEILHYLDADGVATVSAIFRDAPDERQGGLVMLHIPFSSSGFSGGTVATNDTSAITGDPVVVTTGVPI